MPGISLLFGPLLLGVILNAMLYGVCILQSFIYQQTYKQDPKWIRYFVLYLFLLESANTVFDIGLVFEPLVINYGNPKSITISPVMIIADPLVTVLISMPVQFFIAWRIKVITDSWIMPSIIGFFGICAFIGGIATAISVSFIREWANFHHFEGAVITWLAASAVADLLITSTLSLSLYRRKTGVKATDDKISRIIRLTVQTGLVTALFATADVVIFLTVDNTTLNFFWDLALSKLYTNSLLSTLNARAGWDHLTGQTMDDSSNVLFSRSAPLKTTDVLELETNPRHNVKGGVHVKRPDLENAVVIHQIVESMADTELYGSSGFKSNAEKV
ncbi:hypothetical protein CVT26_014404 [Gymnopilus dilepis]|uniref:DUF6534 domain-containing protein n=1 Tax=Gymnopilus dilepis TaxID=231916 RepID=A0A409Y7L0_9AGAR|nr:hypothetical protein CVT26_014404 [Gymnopilus dilepis]